MAETGLVTKETPSPVEATSQDVASPDVQVASPDVQEETSAYEFMLVQSDIY